jgi:hypothetical protein
MSRDVSFKPVVLALLLPAIALIGPSAVAQEPGADQPIVARATAGKCRMVVRGGGAVFAVWLTGLVPGETFSLSDISEHEVINHEATADANGNHMWISLPAVRGKTMGTATVAVKAARCQLSVSYGWQS